MIVMTRKKRIIYNIIMAFLSLAIATILIVQLTLKLGYNSEIILTNIVSGRSIEIAVNFRLS